MVTVMAIPAAQRMPPTADTPRIWRIALALLVFPALAVLSAAQTLAIVGESSKPAQAAAIAPWDGSVKAHLAKGAYQGQLAENAAAVVPPEPWIAALAREAYRRQPLTPEALAVIGSSLPEDERAEFWDLAAATSRRDTLLQGLLLDFQLKSGDLNRSIRTLNQILLVRADQRTPAFAALTQALHDPHSVDTFVDILGSDPEWGDAFLLAASRDKESLENLERIRERLPDDVVEPRTDRALILAFARANRLHMAHRLYARLATPANGAAPGWRSDIPPFDWQFAGEAGFRAQVVAGSERLGLNIARGKGGVFASRILPADGEFLRIRGKHDLKPQQQVERLTISASCVDNGAVLGESYFSASGIALDTAVPADCEFVAIVLSGRAWSDGERVSGSIAPLAIATDS